MSTHSSGLDTQEIAPPPMSPSDERASADYEMWWAAVCREEEAILAAEGQYHVAGVYYANPADATTQRIWEASRRVRIAARERVVAQRARSVA